MKITSEITGKEYKTVDECVADEKDFLAKKEAEEKKNNKKKDSLKKAIVEEAKQIDDLTAEIDKIKRKISDISKERRNNINAYYDTIVDGNIGEGDIDFIRENISIFDWFLTV